MVSNERVDDFLRHHGFEIKYTAKGMSCPPGEEDCLAGKHHHGGEYLVLVKRVNGPKKYKNSVGTEARVRVHGFEIAYWPRENNGLPTLTEIVEFIAKANTWPVDADAVFDELDGRVRPSKAFAMAKLSKRLKEFLKSEEIAELNKFN